MRLLVITSHGDTLNSIRPEAEIFVGLARSGVEITIMTQGDTAYRSRLEAVGIRIVDFVPRKKFSLSAIRTIRTELKRTHYDAVYAFNNKAIANLCVAALGINTAVVTYRGQTGNISKWDPTAYLTHLNPRVDLIICVADAVRESLRAQHPHPDRVLTVYKGHDLDWYAAEPTNLAAFDIPAGAFVVGCVANNRPRKGLPVLVEAAGLLPADAPIHFLLIGSNMDEPGLQTQIKASPYRDRIHVLGFRSDAPEIVAACSATVLPSTKREGLPKTVIESMAYGVAPIVSDSGGSAELVVDGESGIVVAPGDAAALAAAIERL